MDKSQAGRNAVIALALVPLVLWIAERPLADRIAGLPTLLTSAGQVAALVGMALFALTLILSARLWWLEDYFGGVNGAYTTHHAFGGVAFVLMLCHPLALALSYAAYSLGDAADFLLHPATTVAIGMAGLALMTACLLLTYYAVMKYEKWNFTHKFLGLAFFIGGIHAFLITSDISRDTVLRAYMLGLAIIGLAVFAAWTILGRRLARKTNYIITRVTPIGQSIVEIEMTPEKNAVKHEPGQFVFVSFKQDGISGESHPFSISSAPGAPLRIAVKVLGDYTAKLTQLRPGTKAIVEGPYGRFFHTRRPGAPQVWIAGGIGITPFLSKARGLGAGSSSVTLFYCAKSEAEAAFLPELTGVSQRNPPFKLVGWCTPGKSRLTASDITAATGGLDGKEFFICGPTQMMADLRQQLNKLGVLNNRIHTEEFGLK